MGFGKTNLDKLEEKTGQITNKQRGWIIPLARGGYAAKGGVYSVIGIVAAIAAGQGRSENTNARGALETILHQPYGQILLGIVTVGLIGHALWRFVQAFQDADDHGSDLKGIIKRGSFVFVGILYSSLAFWAIKLILGARENNDDARASQEWTAWLLAQPFGQYLVGAVGAGFIAFALYQIYKAISTKFLEQLATEEMGEKTEKFAARTGQIGLTARAVVFAVIGIFLLQAAIQYDASEAQGLSGALRALESQPYGFWIMLLVAFGFIIYGFHMFLTAWYRKLHI